MSNFGNGRVSVGCSVIGSHGATKKLGKGFIEKSWSVSDYPEELRGASNNRWGGHRNLNIGAITKGQTFEASPWREVSGEVWRDVHDKQCVNNKVTFNYGCDEVVASLQDVLDGKKPLTNELVKSVIAHNAIVLNYYEFPPNF